MYMVDDEITRYTTVGISQYKTVNHRKHHCILLLSSETMV